MIYMGSKLRIAKDIISLILFDRTNEIYYEPFCGGCNVIDKVIGERVANDYNEYLIAMWDYLVNRNWKPPIITKEQYDDIKNFYLTYPKHLVGWVGFNCSFRGKFFNGFAGNTNGRDYQVEHYIDIMEQVEKLKGTIFICGSYDKLKIENGSIVYCDPPYRNSTLYSDRIDHDKFWNWCREISSKNKVYISENDAPDDFKIVWSWKLKSSLSRTKNSGSTKTTKDNLYVYGGTSWY